MRDSAGCETAATAQFTLRFPWGDIALLERVPVGRDPVFSMLSRELTSYDNVSWKHAEVTVGDGRVRVQDFQSTNGTYVNGQRIEPFVSVPLADGDEIRFAKDLRVQVRVQK